MKIITRPLLIATLLLYTAAFSFAQDQPLDKEYKTAVVNQLAQLIEDNYVFPDVAESTADHLKVQLQEGHFDKFTTDDSFAEALTNSVQAINHDKHMRVRANPAFEAPEMTPERMIEEQIARLDQSRRANAGFAAVKILDGNVGYLDLRGFAGMEAGKPIADAYMKLMSKTDAIIVDLRKNGGGSPRMVQYLCSFFFDKKVHLNSLYWREGDRTEEFWTLEEVGGKKMPDVPLFVITSNYTFSGAEEFSYNMQTQKRATLVGQTTGGGANPGGTHPVNQNLSVFIPGGRAINPITKTNWEGVGVIPEVKAAEEEAFDKAHQLAKGAAETFRAKRNMRLTSMLTVLNAHLESYEAEKSEAVILTDLRKCVEAEILQEWNINMMGYEYLMQRKKPKVATCIFRANTEIFPHSPNVYDSLGEALMMQGDLEASLVNYQKAVEVATKNGDPDVELYKKNLEALRERRIEKE